MAKFHVATNAPTKVELIAAWIPSQPWGPPVGGQLESVGSFHFDDPDGQVGMETHLVRAGEMLLQVPLTYRDTPIDGADSALVGTMEHTVLGTRWVYDGLSDDRYVSVLAGVVLTGQGQALGMAQFEGRWYVAPSEVRLDGGGWTSQPVAVDGFAIESANTADVVLRNDRFELTVSRQPAERSRPPIGLIATWSGQSNPVVLAEIRERSKSPS